MPSFSMRSKQRLMTCHPKLQLLFNEVIKETDCTILCGHRDKADQDLAVASRMSKAPWPTSKHNSTPSMAVDVAPYPIDWKNTKAFVALADVVMRKAKELGIEVVWGGNFKTLVDLPHYELKDPK